MEDSSERRVTIRKIDEVHLLVQAHGEYAFEIESELHEHFTFEVPNAQHTPKFKAGLWNGKISLYHRSNKTLYVGLLENLCSFCDARKIEIVLQEGIVPPQEISREEVDAFVQSLDIHTKGISITAHRHQIDAVHHALDCSRCILLSPTASGKSLVVYALSRWHMLRGRRVLVVVPTKGLVQQFYSDFEDYSSANGWDVEANCQASKGPGNSVDKQLLFTTWQGIYKLPKEWFQQFDVVFGDEVHGFQAQSLKTIMENLTKVRYRIGLTGTLHGKKVHDLVLEGLYGPIKKIISTKELQDQGKAAPCQIFQFVLEYPEETRKYMASCNTRRTKNGKIIKIPATYKQEIDFLLAHERRNRMLVNMALSRSGNTILLFNIIKHGEFLYNVLRERAEGRNIYFISGDTKVANREETRGCLSDETDAIVCASTGTFTVGINIPSIENIIGCHPTRSTIPVLQRIGRGLRLNIGKKLCNVFDPVDDLSWKAHVNHTLKHGEERYAIYAREEFPTKVISLKL